jgi:proteic killer suppression protein
VIIRNFVHKALRRLYTEGNPKGLPADAVDKLQKMFFALDSLQDAAQLRQLPHWKAHQLTGDRKGTWSLHVTRNWRLTFRIEDDEIKDVNFEDYH